MWTADRRIGCRVHLLNTEPALTMTRYRRLSAGQVAAKQVRARAIAADAGQFERLRQAWGFALLLAAVIALLSILAPQLAHARSAPESFADLADKSLPAVVNVATTQTITADSQMQDLDEMFKDFLDKRQGAKPKPRKATSLGSGFIIDPAGY